MKKRKLWIAPLSISAAIMPIAIAASCDGGGQSSNQASEALYNKIVNDAKTSADLFKYRYESPVDKFTNFNDFDAKLKVYTKYSTGAFSVSSFEYDVTSKYGSYQNYTYDNSSGFLIRKSNMFEPIVNKKTTGISNVEYEVKRPSVWKYSLGLAESVVVTKSDGTKATFNKDDADIFPDYSDATNKTFDEIQYQASSNDAASINSQAFQDALTGAKKIQFTIRKGIKWVDKSGNETNYEVVPEDFYIGWMRTFLQTKSDRHDYLKTAPGFTTEAEQNNIDNVVNSVLTEGATEFTDKETYPNGYLYPLFGFKYSDFSDESKFLETYGSGPEKAVTFNADPLTPNNKGGSLLFEAISTIFDFVAAPSQYIEANASNPILGNPKKLTAAEITTAKNLIKSLPADNIVSKTGLYWYGTDVDHLLTAGPYYYAGYDQSTQKESWKLNKHYYNQEFVNRSSTIQRIDVRYKNQTDSNTFLSQLYQDYKIGKLGFISYNDLSTTNQGEVLGAPSKYGVSYLKSSNIANLKAKVTWRVIPGTPTTKNDIYYNDAYSQLVFGNTSQDVQSGNVKGETKLSELLAGRGLSFRSIINNAVNWEFVQSFLTDNKAQAWINTLAENGKIGGSDAQNNSNNIVLTYYDKLNTLFSLDKDLNKVEYNAGKTEINPNDNITAAESQSSDIDKLRSAGYAKLQEAMTALLDDFYTSHPALDPDVREEDKVTWKFIFRYGNWSPPKMENLFDSNFMPALINNLDTKGRLKVSFTKIDANNPSDYPKWRNALNNYSGGNSAYTFSGWGYDYNAIGSGLDGTTTNGLNAAMVVIGQSAAMQAKLQPTFPELVAASKALVAFIKDGITKGKFKLGVPLDKWAEAGNDFLWQAYYDLQDLEWDATANTVVAATQPYTPFSLITASFFSSYASSITNERNINLAVELSNFNGPTLDTARKISRNYSPSLNNPYFRTPFAGINNSWYEDTIIWSNK